MKENIKNKNTMLRSIQFSEVCQGMTVDSGSVYYRLYGLYPDTYFSYSDFDFSEVLNCLEEDYNVPKEDLVVSRSDHKKGEESIVFIAAKLPCKVLLLHDFSSEQGNPISICYSDKEGEDFKTKLLTQLKSKIKKKRKNNLYMLSKEYDRIGFKPFKLSEDQNSFDIDKHYNDDFKVVDEKIKKCVTRNQQGLVLFHGKPGTGKTTYLKHLVNNYERKVIYIPAEMVKSIGSPGLIDALFKMKGAILLIEDAEEALLERGSAASDSAAVSTLLNITDGFLADVLQLTVFCTFNSKWDQIDHALTRKGRILAKYEFKELLSEKVSDLIGDKLSSNDAGKAMTLAEVFNYEEPEYKGIMAKIGF